MNHFGGKLIYFIRQFLGLIILLVIFFPLVVSAQVTICTCTTTQVTPANGQQEVLKTEVFNNISKADCDKKNKPYLGTPDIVTYEETICSFSGPENFIPSEVDETKPFKFKPSVSLPGTKFQAGQEITVSNNLLGEYISGLYKFFVGIAGILAVIMVAFGGLLWLF